MNVGTRLIADRFGRRAGRAGRAFSLIELIVVIGIMVIVLALAVPAFNKLLQGNNIKQSTNMLSAYVASARAAAQQQRRTVAVVLYEEGAGGYNGQTAVALAYDSTGALVFTPLPGRTPEYLPQGIKVATLSSATTMSEETTTGVCRAILFNASGQVTLQNGLTAVPAASAATAPWNFAGTAACASSPGVLIYDSTDYLNWIKSQSTPSAAAKATWLQAHGDLLIINSYTGGLIR